MKTDKLKYKSITDKILRGFYEVYNELGHGFLESVYENALRIVLNNHGLKVETQKEIQVVFRKEIVGNYRADMLIEDKIILELKTAKAINEIHMAQLMNYLRASEIEIGFLLNFGVKPEFKRIIYNI